MFLVHVVLKCDGLDCDEAMPANSFSSLPMRRDLESIRSSATLWEWSRFRPNANGPNGDYCPRCREKILTAKKAKTK